MNINHEKLLYLNIFPNFTISMSTVHLDRTQGDRISTGISINEYKS